MYDYNPSQADVRAAMDTLRDKGIATVEIAFSGGNDEGGADGTEYLDAEGNKVDGISSSPAYAQREWTGNGYGPVKWVVSSFENGKYVSRDATPDEKALAELNAVLEYPIYDRWGSFAGEFYVHGTLTWDVATGKHTLSGSESHEVWESF